MRALAALTVWLVALCSASCGIGATYWPPEEELQAFAEAGPIEPELDTSRLLPGLPNPGPYRVVSGDILALTGAEVFLADQPDDSAITRPVVLEARVHEDGKLTLPLIGGIEVAGNTLPEIERSVADALTPTFVLERPTIVVRVVEHALQKVAVLGAVEDPGIVELPSDLMSLVGALTEAGGILKATNLKVGAKVIRIRRPGEERSRTLALPVRGLNIPFGDVALEGGETIEVERWDPDIFTVVGLVTKPGAYEYPPNRKYNLMEAIAIAGGTDRIADPPYATVFRKDALGNILAVTFDVSRDDRVRASMVEIRPGDVVSLQHTLGSWSRAVFAQVVRAQVNFFVDPLNP